MDSFSSGSFNGGNVFMAASNLWGQQAQSAVQNSLAGSQAQATLPTSYWNQQGQLANLARLYSMAGPITYVEPGDSLAVQLAKMNRVQQTGPQWGETRSPYKLNKKAMRKRARKRKIEEHERQEKLRRDGLAAQSRDKA